MSISVEAISHGSAKIDKIDNFPSDNKMCQNVISSSSRTRFSPEFISRQVPADHPEGVTFFPPAYADWHYVNPASNAADPKSEEAALKSAQANELRAAMEKELAAMDALGVFERCFIPLGSNLITCTWIFVNKLNADALGVLQRGWRRLHCHLRPRR